MINPVRATVLHAGDSVLIALTDNGWLSAEAKAEVYAQVAEAFPGVRFTLVNGVEAVLVSTTQTAPVVSQETTAATDGGAA